MLSICRVCLTETESSNCISLSQNDTDSLETRKKFQFCAVGINIDLVTDPVMCASCTASLEHAYRFKRAYLQSEKQIRNYSETTKINSHIELSHLLQHFAILEAVGVSSTETNEANTDSKQANVGEDRTSHESTTVSHQSPGNNENICTNSTQTGSDRELRSLIRKRTEEVILDGKRFKCTECGDRFKIRSALKHHENLHASGKTYKCHLCRYTGVTKQSLESHLQKHGIEKPYRCDNCNYKCKTSNILKRHMRTHVTEKPFKCKVCERDFRYRRSLQLHLYTHTEEKQFLCDLCGYKCIKRSIFTKHRQNAHYIY